MGTRLRRYAWVVPLLPLVSLLPLRAQSLADVARKEEVRRQQVKEPSKVYTNKDLGSVQAPPATASTPTDKATVTDEKAKESGNDKEPVKDQAYWAARVRELQAALDRDQLHAEALQSRVNALTTDFAARDDPAQRAVIERDRQRTLAELDRLKKQIVTDKKAIDDLQEEARRAGVPPGWLRS